MAKKFLYFIQGDAPTNEEFEKAQKHMDGPMLQFVSLPTLDLNAPPLENAGVAGAVPEVYLPKEAPKKK